MGNKNSWGLYDPRAPYNVSPIEQWDTSNKARAHDGFGQMPDSVVQCKHDSARHSYGTSPVYNILGTSSMGRRPTSYSRRVYSQVTNQNARIVRESDYGHKGYVDSPMVTTDFTNAVKGTKAGPFLVRDRDPYDDVDFANALNRAVTECLIKLGDNKVDLGVAIAELGKTSTHLAKTGIDIWKSIKALRGRSWNELFSILSKRSAYAPKINPGMTAAKYWLEYNYAWKPLLMDAYGIMELLQLQLKPALLVHANKTVSWPLKFDTINLTAANWWDQSASYDGSIKTESTCRLTGQIDNTALRKASQGLTNPASILWELVPYSFVIDWSLPIGNYLQAATATQGLSFVWGSTTQRYFAQGRASLSGQVGRWGVWEQRLERQGNAEFFKFGMQRLVLGSFPRPVLYAKSPFSSSHAFSALALLRGLF